jgi:hypothetical protein
MGIKVIGANGRCRQSTDLKQVDATPEDQKRASKMGRLLKRVCAWFVRLEFSRPPRIARRSNE